MIIAIMITIVITVPIAVIVPVMIATVVPAVVLVPATLTGGVQISSPLFCLPAVPAVLANLLLKFRLRLLEALAAFMPLVRNRRRQADEQKKRAQGGRRQYQLSEPCMLPISLRVQGYLLSLPTTF